MSFTDNDLKQLKDWLKSYPYVTTNKDFDRMSAALERFENDIEKLKDLYANCIKERGRYREALIAISRGLFSTRNAKSVAEKALSKSETAK